MTCPERSLVDLTISRKSFRAAGTYFAWLTLKIDGPSHLQICVPAGTNGKVYMNKIAKVTAVVTALQGHIWHSTTYNMIIVVIPAHYCARPTNAPTIASHVNIPCSASWSRQVKMVSRIWWDHKIKYTPNKSTGVYFSRRCSCNTCTSIWL